MKQDKKEKKPKVNKEVEVLNDKILRLTAEIQNMKRRNEEEIHRLLKYEGEEFIVSFLHIVDNFERAIAMDDDNLHDEVSKFLSGFKFIYADTINLLKAIGVEEIKALGEQFDPNTMNAVMTDSILEEESNIVLDVLQKGYIYKDKVIRPAMVKVNE